MSCWDCLGGAEQRTTPGLLAFVPVNLQLQQAPWSALPCTNSSRLCHILLPASSSHLHLRSQVGEVSYSQRNLFGLGQRLVASAKLGQVGAADFAQMLYSML